MIEFLILVLLSIVYGLMFELPKGALFCGLAGYSGRVRANPHILRLLLLDNKVRGSHSCGIGGDNGVFKNTDDPEDFIKNSAFNDFGRAKNVLVHNRFATTGDVNPENAHPWVFGKGSPEGELVGMHNGWIPWYKDQARVLGYNNNEIPEVDSMFIFDYLIRNGRNPKKLSEIEGAMALAWIWDGKMWLYRRSSKPLFIGKENRSGIYFSSRAEGMSDASLDCITKISPNFVYVFKEGELDNIIKVAEPICKISEDGSPSAFDYNAPNEFWNKFFDGKKKTYSSTASSRYDRDYDDAYDEYSMRGNCIVTDHRRRTHNRPKVDERLSLFENTLDKDVMTGKGDNTWIEMNSGKYGIPKKLNIGSTSYIVAEITDSSSNKPVREVVVWSDSCEDMRTLVSETGLVVLPIPKEYCDKPFRIYAKKAGRDAGFYTKLLTIRTGEIMEVSLSYPFREGKEGRGSESESSSSSTETSSTLLLGEGSNAHDDEQNGYACGSNFQSICNQLEETDKRHDGYTEGEESEGLHNRNESGKELCNGEEENDANPRVSNTLMQNTEATLLRFDEEENAWSVMDTEGNNVMWIPRAHYSAYNTEYTRIKNNMPEILRVAMHRVQYIVLRFYGRKIEDLCLDRLTAKQLIFLKDVYDESMTEEMFSEGKINVTDYNKKKQKNREVKEHKFYVIEASLRKKVRNITELEKFNFVDEGYDGKDLKIMKLNKSDIGLINSWASANESAINDLMTVAYNNVEQLSEHDQERLENVLNSLRNFEFLTESITDTCDNFSPF